MGGSSDEEGAARYPRVDYSAPPAGKPGVELREVDETPLGVVLFRSLWEGTKGTLSLDLKRPTIPRHVAARNSLLSFRKREGAQATGPATRPSQFAAARPAPLRRPVDEQRLAVVPFADTGARLKVMRHVHLGPVYEGVKGTGGKKQYPALDFGVGLNFELDTAELQPLARLKLWDVVSLRTLPRAGIKLSKRLPVPNSDWGVRLSYECPLGDVSRFWEPPATLMVSIDNLGNSGVRLTQQGVEFSGQVSFNNGNLTVRGSGHVDFPQRLPVEEGEPLVRYELRRLGLKANW